VPAVWVGAAALAGGALLALLVPGRQQQRANAERRRATADAPACSSAFCAQITALAASGLPLSR